MKVGIIQSNYIPWRGYFDFIDDVELFVYLDDVQYTRRDWRNRNRIKTSNGLVWLTVPVVFSRDAFDTKIEAVKIDYSEDWIKKHIDSIRHSYSKARFYKQFSEEFYNTINQGFKTISELNINTNNWIMETLDIKTEIKKSSDFAPVGTKTDRLIDILKKAGATGYLSGASAKDYLEVEKFREAGIGLEFKAYEYKEYPQLFGGFEQNVTVLDLLFNCGPDARKYLKSLKKNERIL